MRKTDRSFDSIIDEEGDPGGYDVREYNGNFFISSSLNAQYEFERRESTEPLTPGRVTIESVDGLLEEIHFTEPIFKGPDTRFELEEEVLQTCFPHYNGYFNDQNIERDEVENQFSRAVHAELQKLIEYVLKCDEQLARSDPLSKTLNDMKVTKDIWGLTGNKGRD